MMHRRKVCVGGGWCRWGHYNRAWPGCTYRWDRCARAPDACKRWPCCVRMSRTSRCPEARRHPAAPVLGGDGSCCVASAPGWPRIPPSFGNESLKAMAMRRTTTGLTQVIINDLDEGVRPASILDSCSESVLTRRAFTMRKHLVQGRLADIHQGLAAEVMGVDFRMVGNGHEVPSPGVIDRSVMVAINFTTAASACAWPAGEPLL